ncbi:TPA: hypothetical protein ACOQZT_002457 [Serratia odorifera]
MGRLWSSRCRDKKERILHQGGDQSQQRQDLGADWVRQNGEVIIGGDWIIESGITDVAQLEITAAPGVIRLQRREVEGFLA